MSTKLPRFSVLVLLTLLFAIPAAAQKHRAVRKSPPEGQQITLTINGTVLDATTNAPVSSVEVRAGSKLSYSGADGKFRVKDVLGFGSVKVTFERSGYVLKTETITSGGTQDLTFRLTPTPTVRVRKTNNTTFDLDSESVKFGYVLTFGGYAEATFDEFCKPDGSQVTLDRAQMKKITGPATKVAQSNCCENPELMKINVQLKTNETFDAVFKDSCFGYRVDLIGREHVSGNFAYIPFFDIAEVVFP